MEESDTKTHKVSDSGYSNSCNSQSQRSSGSSKSRHSNSSGSSGYGGHPSTLGSGIEVFPQPLITKRNKDKEHKKKKLKSTSVTAKAEHHAEAKTLVTSPASALETTAINETTKSINKASSKTVCKIAGKVLGQCASNAGATGTNVLPSEATPSTQPALSSVGQSPGKKFVPDVTEETENCLLNVADLEEKEITSDSNRSNDEPIVQTENEFSTIVSLNDGVVMYTTSTITSVLGFPKDMWLGRSFIDFVHPKDRMAFASHITTGVSLPVEENQCKVSLVAKESFYCCLRQYRGLKSSGYGVTEKKVTYLPFHLTMTFRDVSSTDKVSLAGEEPGIQGPFLIILATLVKSAYTYPEETKNSPKFLMRHQASCLLSHVDSNVVQYLGYLPQDMVNRSVFEFYHPEDSPYLKEVYEGVVKAQGQTYRSKPYRFRAQNGGYVLMDTEWSAFINPWSRQLEFVIGQHRVLKGPSNPDVFSSQNEEENVQISEEVLKESKVIQQEIENLLKETVQRTTEVAKQQASQRCKDLAIFMESLMEEVSKPELKVDLPTEDHSFSERDSVMLGEISPHHDYYDSKSSSETPPSYNQLNYNENIQRFFESKPKTTLSDESGESKMEANRSNSTDEEGKNMPVADSSIDLSNRKCCSPVNGSGSGSGGSSGSAGIPGSAASRGDTSATNMSNGSYQPTHLTEALLYRHNEDMEKQMVQKHRELRAKGERECKKKIPHEKLQESNHGVKRSGSHSWESEPFKASKHAHVETLIASGGGVPLPNVAAMGGTATVPPIYSGSPNVNLWPPFSVTVTPLQSSQPCFAHSTYSGATLGSSQSPHMTNMIPVYYIPTGSQQTNLPPRGMTPQEHPGPPQTGMLFPGQTPYIPSQVPVINSMPSMLYHPVQPMYGAPPMLYSSLMLQPSTILPAPMSQTGIMSAASRSMMKQDKPLTEAMSECSKKDKSLCSPGAQTLSPSPDEDKPREIPDANDFGPPRETENTTGDESSYSSFYSFLRTDKSDESMKSSSRDKDFPYSCKLESMNWERGDSGKKLISQDKPRPILKDPPWLEHVNVTPELIYQYQINEKNLETVLENDLQVLREIQQPFLVNDQLSQLYLDLELEGLSTKLKLEERITSSSSGSGSSCSGGEEVQGGIQNKKKRRSIEYGKFVMIFEENAPLPPPVTQ
uniref:Period circadian protein n=1 Tax=Apteronemobius asahinai TaxID=746126 RepID=H7C8F4_9ORTH|nr:PERIOD, isoform 2 [Apteronemobius asahinai]